MKPKLFLLLLSTLFFTSVFANETLPEANTCRQSDSLNLLTLYHEFGNHYLRWDLSQAIDTWQGIRLNSNGCVIEIRLEEDGLSGPIPPEIGNFASLNYLSFADNRTIIGEIPPEIGNLTNLGYLNLCENGLTGSIPPEIGKLENLWSLNLFINDLEGELPKEFGNLTNLEELQLNRNYLSGCFNQNLKSLCTLGSNSFENLEEAIYYNYNNFDARWRDFCDNDAGACNPNSACRQTDSLNLIAFYNTFEKKPDWDFNMPIDTWEGITLNGNGCIIEIDLSDICSIGNLTTELTNLNHLTKLDLGGCDITGSIPAEIGNLTSLTYLSLADNLITGEIPPEIGSLTNLKYLNLCENKLEGHLPGELGSLTMLQNIYLQENNLSGCFNQALKNICELVIFVSNDDDDDDGGFGDNNFDVSWYDFCQNDKGICNPYSPCRQLDSLNLIALYNNFESGLNWDLTKPIDTWHGIKLTGSGCVKAFFIDDESVCGAIAPEIGNLSHMTKFGLPENCLTGTIPPEIGQLTNLTYLSLDQNNLTGTLPQELANLTKLDYLDLSRNNLAGCFHNSLSGLCQAEYIIVDNDAFDATWEDFCNYASGSCCENPATDIYWNGNNLLLESMYQAQNSIETNNDGHHRVIVPLNKRAVLKAGKHITLNGNFTVGADINFIMAIDTCK